VTLWKGQSEDPQIDELRVGASSIVVDCSQPSAVGRNPVESGGSRDSFVNTKVGDGIFHQDTPSRYRQHSAYSSVRL
jgi:hypothetical protein